MEAEVEAEAEAEAEAVEALKSTTSTSLLQTVDETADKDSPA